jgi:hypothetical protein
MARGGACGGDGAGERTGQGVVAALPGKLDAHTPVAVGVDRVFALSHDLGVHGAWGRR